MGRGARQERRRAVKKKTGGGVTKKKNVMRISLSKRHYSAGDVARGTVDLEANAEEDGRSQESHIITLTLIGRAKTRVVVVLRSSTASISLAGEPAGGGATSRVDEDQKDIIAYDMQLATLQRKAISGVQSFPFSVVLPPGLPPSMQERAPDGSACAIVYGFEARLHCPWDASAAYFDAWSSTKFEILPTPDENTAAPPASVIVEPESAAMATCFFNSGSMSVGFGADRSTAGKDHPVTVTVAASNNSSCKASGLQIRIRQHSDWYADGAKGSSTRTIATLDVPASQLGSALSVAKKGHARKATAGDAVRAELREMLAAGTGSKHKLAVTERCHPTMQTGIIEVRHSLCVRVRAKGWNPGPEVFMPLRVLQNKGGGEGGGRERAEGGGEHPAKTVVEAADEEAAAIEHAAALNESAHRELRPVPVPHGAVTLDYNTNIIGPPIELHVYS